MDNRPLTAEIRDELRRIANSPDPIQMILVISEGEGEIAITHFGTLSRKLAMAHYACDYICKQIVDVVTNANGKIARSYANARSVVSGVSRN